MDIVDGRYELQLSAMAQCLRCVCRSCEIAGPVLPGLPLVRQPSGDERYSSTAAYTHSHPNPVRTHSCLSLTSSRSPPHWYHTGSVHGGYAAGYSGMASSAGATTRSRSKFLRDNPQQKSMWIMQPLMAVYAAFQTPLVVECSCGHATHDTLTPALCRVGMPLCGCRVAPKGRCAMRITAEVFL